MAAVGLPRIDEFAEVLQEEERWYQLGIFLGASTKELNIIDNLKNHSTCDILMLLIQLYDCLERKGKSLSWVSITTALRRIGNHNLAEKIHTKYLKGSAVQEHGKIINQGACSSSNVAASASTNTISTTAQQDGGSSCIINESVDMSAPVICDTDPLPSIIVPPRSSNEPLTPVELEEHQPVCLIANEFKTLSYRFQNIVLKVKRAVKSENVDLEEIQDVIRRQCGLAPLPQAKMTVAALFTRIEEHCSIVNFHVLEFIIENLLSNGKVILQQLATLKQSVDIFKSSANMVELVTLIKSKQTTPNKGQKRVKLKVREFWTNFTYKQFEIVINDIFQTLYDIMTHISVKKGCICLSWMIPDIDTSMLIPALSIEFIRLIGVIHLSIGDKVIYNIEGEGCESVEAAMLQSIELRNSRAIELLLAVGCSPQVATYIDDNTVFNIVNIRPAKVKNSSFISNGHVEHVCILGEEEHVDAIVDPSHEPECSSCNTKQKMIKQLCHEVSQVKHLSIAKVEGLQREIDKLRFTLKEKEALIDATVCYDIPGETYSHLIKHGGYPREDGGDRYHGDDGEMPQTKKMIAEVVQEMSTSTGKPNSTTEVLKAKQISNLSEEIKLKDAEITLLKKSNEILIKESHVGKKPIADLDLQREQDYDKIANYFSSMRTPPLPISFYEYDKSTAVFPRRKLSVGANMKVKFTSRDNDGKELPTGGSVVRAILASIYVTNENQQYCPVLDNEDGTCTITVVPQRIGQYGLSIIVNGKYIEGCPFRLDIVSQRDYYTQLNIEPSQTIGVSLPKYMAFSANGDLFVTTGDCIQVYDAKSNYLKTIIGSKRKRNSVIEFKSPHGIDINGDTIYVAESGQHRIHKLSIKGNKFIGTFGGYGSGIGQFKHPCDVKVSPMDGKVYVADKGNNRVQVFNPDCQSVSHVIDDPESITGDEDLFNPMGIAFDLSGNVHVTGYRSYSGAVFDAKGQLVRFYGNKHAITPSGIAIDSYGHCLVNDFDKGNLLIFNPSGVLINSTPSHVSSHSHGVSTSPVDDSVWVAETNNNSLYRF